MSLREGNPGTLDAVLTFRPQIVSACVEDHMLLLYEDSRGAKALADPPPPSSENSKHVHVRYHGTWWGRRESGSCI